MDTEEKEWVIHTLKEHERRQCISNVLDIDKKPAVAKGDNYASDMYRLNLKIVTKNGNITNRSVILKSMPDSKEKRDFLSSFNVYSKEKKMFLQILPELDKIRRDSEIEGEPLSATCYGVLNSEKFLLEDLSVLGYRVAGERQGLDFDHCALVMKSLGKFHALGAVFKERCTDGMLLEGFDKYFWQMNPEVGESMCRNNFSAVSEIVEEKWKGEWLQYVDGLRKTGETIVENVLKKMVRDKTRFTTLAHGDLWFKNMMFKYGDDGKPVHVRFVDYQMCYFNHVGLDYNYFYWTSAHTDVRPRKAELFKIYYEYLRSSLIKYGYSKEPPSYEEILEDCESAAVFGVACSVSFLPFMIGKKEDVPDLQKLTENLSDSSSFVFIDKNKDEGEDYTRTIKYILKEARELSII